jgi:amidophosphoribosyltransferase
MLALLKEHRLEHLLQEVYGKCKAQEHAPKEEIVNYVKALYAPFTDEQISNKIAEIIRPDDIRAEVSVIYQTVENLHEACPDHKGDWYFTGNYPTPGGNKVVNKAFINFMEGISARSY